MDMINPFVNASAEVVGLDQLGKFIEVISALRNSGYCVVVKMANRNKPYRTKIRAVYTPRGKNRTTFFKLEDGSIFIMYYELAPKGFKPEIMMDTSFLVKVPPEIREAFGIKPRATPAPNQIPGFGVKGDNVLTQFMMHNGGM